MFLQYCLASKRIVMVAYVQLLVFERASGIPETFNVLAETLGVIT